MRLLQRDVTLGRFTVPFEQNYDLKIKEVIKALKKAKRPVIIAGNGIALSGAVSEFRALVRRLNIPVIGTFARYDIVNDDDALYAGQFGSIGHRAGNFAVQNSDLILAIGARLNIRAVSYNWGCFGREAVKIVVDIDDNELKKHTLTVDIPVLADAGEFIRGLLSSCHGSLDCANWVMRCQHYRNTFPTIIPQRQAVGEKVDSYNFFDVLSDCAADDTIFVF